MSDDRKNGKDNPRVEDPGEFNQRKRLEAIASARRDAREVRLQTEIGKLGHDSPERVFYTAVQNYAMELQWLMHRHGNGRYRKQELGEITVPVPPQIEVTDWGSPVVNTNGVQAGKVLGNPEINPKTVPVIGVIPSDDTSGPSYLELSPIITKTWTVTVDEKHKRPEPQTFSQTVEVPYSVTLAAFQLCNSFVEEIHLDARIEAETDVDAGPF